MFVYIKHIFKLAAQNPATGKENSTGYTEQCSGSQYRAPEQTEQGTWGAEQSAGRTAQSSECCFSALTLPIVDNFLEMGLMKTLNP